MLAPKPISTLGLSQAKPVGTVQGRSRRANFGERFLLGCHSASRHAQMHRPVGSFQDKVLAQESESLDSLASWSNVNSPSLLPDFEGGSVSSDRITQVSKPGQRSDPSTHEEHLHEFQQGQGVHLATWKHGFLMLHNYASFMFILSGECPR